MSSILPRQDRQPATQPAANQRYIYDTPQGLATYCNVPSPVPLRRAVEESTCPFYDSPTKLIIIKYDISARMFNLAQLKLS